MGVEVDHPAISRRVGNGFNGSLPLMPCEDVADIIADATRGSAFKEKVLRGDLVPALSEPSMDSLELGPKQGGCWNVWPARRLEAGLWLFTPARDRVTSASRVSWPRALFEVKEGKEEHRALRLHLFNSSNQRQQETPLEEVGYLERVTKEQVVMEMDGDGKLDASSLTPVVPYTQEEEEHYEQVWTMLRANITKDLTSEQEAVLRALVYRFHKTWTLDSETPPAALLPEGFEPKIVLQEGAVPQSEPRRRQSYRKRLAVEEIVQKYLQAGYIEPSRSPWAAPVVLVRKKDGTFRMVIDYRKLNAVTVQDRWPIPKISELLEELGGKPWISLADARDGFMGLPLRAEDKDKTAFLTHLGLFQWRRMPQGWTGSPATYMRVMDVVLSGLKGVCVLAYVDDVTVLSHSFKQHIVDLFAVFRRFEEHRMTWSVRKTFLCQEKAEFLGFEVSEMGIRPSAKKVAAVTDWPVPMTKKGVRSFLGFANYFRRHIAGCAQIMAPLTALTKAEVPEKLPPGAWTDECQAAFVRLKRILCSAPLLRHPDFTKRFFVDADSCKGGVGGVLVQKFLTKRVNKRSNAKKMVELEHPIAYFSKQFTKEERLWGSTELEAIGVIKCLDEFRPYVYGVDFTLRTDSVNVGFAWLKRQTSGRLARWSARLAEFDGYMTVQYKAGKTHGHADGLSRMEREEREEDPNEPWDASRSLGLGVPPPRPAEDRKRWEERDGISYQDLVSQKVADLAAKGLAGNQVEAGGHEGNRISVVSAGANEGKRISVVSAGANQGYEGKRISVVSTGANQRVNLRVDASKGNRSGLSR